MQPESFKNSIKWASESSVKKIIDQFSRTLQERYCKLKDKAPQNEISLNQKLLLESLAFEFNRNINTALDIGSLTNESSPSDIFSIMDKIETKSEETNVDTVSIYDFRDVDRHKRNELSNSLGNGSVEEKTLDNLFSKAEGNIPIRFLDKYHSIETNWDLFVAEAIEEGFTEIIILPNYDFHQGEGVPNPNKKWILKRKKRATHVLTTTGIDNMKHIKIGTFSLKKLTDVEKAERGGLY